jgi:RNA polymerase sigma factor (sigma-70 family)
MCVYSRFLVSEDRTERRLQHVIPKPKIEDRMSFIRHDFYAYYSRLAAMLYGMGARSGEAEECVHDAFVSLTRCQPYPDNAWAYLLKASRNRYVSLLRKRRIISELDDASPHDLDMLLTEEPSPARALQIVEAIAILLQSQSEAADERDQTHGQAILLWLAGFSQTEIAEQLHVPLKTVHHWLRHGFSTTQIDRIRSLTNTEHPESLTEALRARLEHALDRQVG